MTNDFLIDDMLKELGEKYLSDETGFIHFNYKNNLNKKDLSKNYKSIPILENFCFCYLLFKTKEVKNIQRGLELVLKLFHFFDKENGFPIYLHEYPECTFFAVNVEILSVLYWMMKDFKKYFEKDLKTKFQDIFDSLLKLSLTKKEILSPTLYFKVLAIAYKVKLKDVKIGDNLINDNLTDDNLINEIISNEDYFFSKKDLLNIVLSLQIIDLSMKKYESFYKKIICFYNPYLNKFPFLYNVYMDKMIEKIDHIDLFFLNFFGKLKKDHFKNNATFLFFVIFKPICKNRLESLKLIENISLNNYEIYKDKISLAIYKNKSQNIKRKKGAHLFRFFLKDRRKILSFVLENFNGYVKNEFLKNEKQFLSHFQYDNNVKLDENELMFFTENIAQILVNGKKATCFKRNDILTISLGKNILSISFINPQNIKFVGHIFRFNRLSQNHSRDDKTKAFDYMISLRTIDRQEKAQISLKIKFVNKR